MNNAVVPSKAGNSLREALQNCSALRVQCAWKDVAKLP